jgi:hypothetical protein
MNLERFPYARLATYMTHRETSHAANRMSGLTISEAINLANKLAKAAAQTK